MARSVPCYSRSAADTYGWVEGGKALATPQESALVELLPGRTLGRYELLMPVAKGGMGQLWAAQLRGARDLEDIVAIKTLLPDLLDTSRSEQMFIEEARIASQIHHPNVVQALALGEEAGSLYLVMEWVHGEPLSRFCQQAAANGGLPIPVIVNIVGQACRGLHSAHELRGEDGALLGVVHRDVTPHNLLVTYAGTTKLVDFGIAKATAQGSSLTQAGEVKGKVPYMSPEQLCGQPLDRRADIFSLGVMLYLVTTGEHPFKGDSHGEIVRNLCAPFAPRPPSELVPSYPRALEAVVLRALEKEPEARWRTAQDLLAALTAAVPEAFQEGFEARVAECMSEVFGARGVERLEALSEAQRLAAQGRHVPAHSGVSFKRIPHDDAQDTGSVSRRIADIGPNESESTGSSECVVTSERLSATVPESAVTGMNVLAPVRARAGGMAALLITSIIGLCSLLLGLVLGYRPHPEHTLPQQDARAPAAVPADSEARPIRAIAAEVRRVPAPASRPLPMPPPAGASAARQQTPHFEEAPLQHELEPAAKPAPRAARRQAPVTPGAAAAEAPPPSVPERASTPAQAAPERASAPASAAPERATKQSEWKGNAWNTDAFGGRD
jgi:hypothetical protein